jgi:hypothetical protein
MTSSMGSFDQDHVCLVSPLSKGNPDPIGMFGEAAGGIALEQNARKGSDQQCLSAPASPLPPRCVRAHLHVARQQPLHEGDGPLLERLGQHGVVGEGEDAGHDGPALGPAQALVVHQQPHQLRHADRGVRVVQLQRHLEERGQRLQGHSWKPLSSVANGE